MERKPLFPLAVNLAGRECIVIGEHKGEAGHRAQALEECGALVLRVGEDESLDEERVSSAFLVLSTSRNEGTNARLHELALRHRFLLWCIDQPHFGSVCMMAVAKSGPVRLAASTSGVAPSVSKAFRKGLERALDDKFDRFVARIGSMRERLRGPERMKAVLDVSRGFEVRVQFCYPEWFD